MENDLNREKRYYDELALRNREINSFENIKRKTLNELENKFGDYTSFSSKKEIEIKQKELKILEEKGIHGEEDKNKTIEEIYKIKD